MQGGGGIDEERLMMELLATMGVKRYEQALASQLVECMHRFSEDVLRDGHDFAVHAARKTTEIEDLKLALRVREASSLPSRDAMFDLAREVNSAPFPPIVGLAGLRLPAPECQITNRPFRIVQKRNSTATTPLAGGATNPPTNTAATSSAAGAASGTFSTPHTASDGERPTKKARTHGKPHGKHGSGKQLTILVAGLKNGGGGGGGVGPIASGDGPGSR